MALMRCQVVLQYFTNIPEDVASNTLYFVTSGTEITEAECEEAVTRLAAFYSGFDEYLAPTVVRSPGASVNIYDMADSMPRQPLFPGWGFTLAASNSAFNIPTECAIVMSYHAAFTSGIPNARRRGRIYLGPWNGLSNNSGGATEFSQPASALVTAITGAADELSTLHAEDIVWSQRSSTTQAVAPVAGGWVDNAWDTQRRRGNSPTNRTTFTITP